MADKKLFLGRTARSWGEIFVFYVFYYACIAAFYSATVGMFYGWMDVHKPSAAVDMNWLDQNPGMGYAPKVGLISSLVYVKKETVEKNVEKIEEKLKHYNNTFARNTKALDTCIGENSARKDKKKACQFNARAVIEQGNCKKSLSYGYSAAYKTPCILVWMNNIYDFTPEPLGCNDKHGDKTVSEITNNNCDASKPKVYINCQGETVADRENIEKITYYPHQGFDIKYFPYLNQPSYQQPLVFVQVEVKYSYVPVIMVCELIAKNIETDPTPQGDYLGSARFDVIVDM